MTLIEERWWMRRVGDSEDRMVCPGTLEGIRRDFEGTGREPTYRQI
jgi:hypothetical protein